MQDVRGKRITLAGLGHFGGQIGAARWLVENSAQVLITDTKSAVELSDSVEKIKDLPVEWRLGEHRIADFTGAELVVASPAIPPDNQYLVAARAAGVPITTEIRLFVERCAATIVGVTGTKGKSTTTALLNHMLQTRFTVWRGGNIGGSLLCELDKIDKTHLVVLELSSYMLEYLGAMKWSPHVSVVTMLAADHLKWHGSLQAYRNAKANIVRFQRPDDIAVLNETDAPSMELAGITAARVMRFGVERRREFQLLIPGRHNQFNAQAAFAAAGALGVAWDAAQEAVRDFPGLSHRLQLVHEEHGVRYFNDSIATIPQSAIAALESFPPKKVIQIVGGSDHELPITEMCNALVERAKAVLCIGDTGEQLADLMSGNPHATAAAIYRCGDLPTAIQIARQVAVTGDVVLLSTGYKSFDQFGNYEQRGDAFARLARG
jgi:UDP-N-acetylmuramoylalanine--D-glutamate ligase